MNCIFLDLFKEFWLSVTLMMIRLKTFVLLREYMRKVFGDLNWRETRCPLMSIWIRESRQIIVFLYPFLLNGYLGHFFLFIFCVDLHHEWVYHVSPWWTKQDDESDWNPFLYYEDNRGICLRGTCDPLSLNFHS